MQKLTCPKLRYYCVILSQVKQQLIKRLFIICIILSVALRVIRLYPLQRWAMAENGTNYNQTIANMYLCKKMYQHFVGISMFEQGESIYVAVLFSWTFCSVSIWCQQKNGWIMLWSLNYQFVPVLHRGVFKWAEKFNMTTI